VASDRVRIEIGFYAGQALSLLVEQRTAEEVENALSSGKDGAIHVEAEDGAYTIALGKVVYVKRFAREGRLGFGNP
jgi:hypothetical protein